MPADAGVVQEISRRGHATNALGSVGAERDLHIGHANSGVRQGAAGDV